MSHSLNEIEAHAKRAARGAGLSWGMSEEAGKATRWLASHDLAGPALLSAVLTKNDGQPHAQVAPAALNGAWRGPAGDLCPFAAGVTLNDCADRLAADRAVEMVNVSYPLLVLPFAAWASMHLKRPVRLAWQDLRIDTDGDGIWLEDPESRINTEKAAMVICEIGTTHENPARRPGKRGTVSTDIWERLNTFAKRTYAPATEASRLLGAGAGATDND